MTIRELIVAAGRYPLIIILLFTLPPLLVVAMRLIHQRGRGEESPWKYLYSILVHYVCVPGILSIVMIAYTVFFTKGNLLDVDVLVYILPVVCMFVTLILIWQIVSFDKLPGFQRLWGLIVMITMAFVIMLIIDRTRIWLVFGGSIFVFILLAGGIFALLKWGSYMAFRRRDQPKRKPPDFPTK